MSEPNKPRKEVRSSFLAGLAAAAALAVGCAQLPSQPTVETPAIATEEVSTAHEVLLSGVTQMLQGLLVKTLNVVGSVGGTLTNARWKVTIPPGAVDGCAEVGIGVTSSTSPECKLEIYPPEKNAFKVPVTLTVDCRNVALSELKTYVIHWYNPATKTWEPVAGSKVDLTKKTVSAPLSHFSYYRTGPRGGKAGW